MAGPGALISDGVRHVYSCGDVKVDEIQPCDDRLVEMILALGYALKDREGRVCPAVRIPPAMAQQIVVALRAPDPVEHIKDVIKRWTVSNGRSYAGARL